MEHLNLIAIVGSLRAASVNAAVARAAAAHAPRGATITQYPVDDIPFYNGDEEEAGPPEVVTAMTEAIGGCDGLIFFSPEYNNSLPAVVKNVIDWLSRPPRAWEGTPVTVVTATPGGRAGLGIRTHVSQILEHQPVRDFEPHGIGSYWDKMENGELTDEDTLHELGTFLERFVGFCQAESE